MGVASAHLRRPATAIGLDRGGSRRVDERSAIHAPPGGVDAATARTARARPRRDHFDRVDAAGIAVAGPASPIVSAYTARRAGAPARRGRRSPRSARTAPPNCDTHRLFAPLAWEVPQPGASHTGAPTLRTGSCASIKNRFASAAAPAARATGPASRDQRRDDACSSATAASPCSATDRARPTHRRALGAAVSAARASPQQSWPRRYGSVLADQPGARVPSAAGVTAAQVRPVAPRRSDGSSAAQAIARSSATAIACGSCESAPRARTARRVRAASVARARGSRRRHADARVAIEAALSHAPTALPSHATRTNGRRTPDRADAEQQAARPRAATTTL